ncbi:DUF2813 domain-containing protein [Vibrio breoganii]|uniref:retron Ec78 anti-phage system effector ATPase PtuA n=1 Tax=Vibrio breoganii TaxID=553239 RepID=UPI000C857AB1|nr:retron Ec78 anti-phage system effector ATPase PtuA [Vibrio breoganii]PMM79336.1 hypothetical protein BCT44_15420 [Vibrio breoganii]TKF84847.1 DUF2813 domain-containing protein [Vibrio breoganii]
MNNKRSRLKSLEVNARKGNISSSYELYLIYKNGDGVDVDLSLADDYLNFCFDSISFNFNNGVETPNNRLRVERLDLINFKKFDELSIEFESDVTVIIGSNGAGKTTILDGLSRIFSWISARIIMKKRSGKPLTDFDVKINSNDTAEVISTFCLGKKTRYTGSLARASKGIETNKSSNLDGFNNLSSMYRSLYSDQLNDISSSVNIPLLAFYSVDRSHIKSNLSFSPEKISDSMAYSPLDAIDRSVLDGSGNIEEFLKWFIILDNLAEYTSDDKQLSLLKAELELLATIVTDESSPLWDTFTEKKTHLEQLTLSDKNSASTKAYKDLQQVKDAIVSAVPSVSDIFVDRSSGRVEIKIINDKQTINIFQASRGQLVYISLVADIARRLTELNSNLSVPLHGQGIIIIDELELHLHPEWQQNIVAKLIQTFPNIQFIITTHSPQVLSALPSKKIRKLGKNKEDIDIVSRPLAESYARSSSDVLESVMFVNPTPSYPEEKLLKRYRKIIEQGDIHSRELKDLEQDLLKALGSNHPELVRLAMVKRRRELLE